MVEDIGIERFPQSKYVDAVRWIPSPSSLNKYVAMALYDSDSSDSTIEIHDLHNRTTSSSSSSLWSCSSRVSCLRALRTSHRPLLAASTFDASLHFLLLQPAAIESHLSLPANSTFHLSPISGIDFLHSGSHCVTVAGDGRVNLATLLDSGFLTHRRLYDSQGLVSYTAVKSASPTEFATGGLGSTLHWWDHRKPGAPVSNFKPPAASSGWGSSSGMIHSIDIHESRKHICVAGGSFGSVFGWDLRRPGQAIVLSSGPAACDGEVWEVQYDCYKQSNTSNVLTCSEDGIVALIQQGNEPAEIMAEPCAVNSLDIDPQNPAEVICSLEWESVALITRQ